MIYLHAPSDAKPVVVHRDLKPQNVLLHEDGRAKVCDFGISKAFTATAASSTRLQPGTPSYMAPEQFEGRPVTDRVDVFAFGVLLWECLARRQPWRELSAMQIIFAVGIQGERLPRPSGCPDGLWALIESCWREAPEQRPPFNAILPAVEEEIGLVDAAEQQERQRQQERQQQQEKQQQQQEEDEQRAAGLGRQMELAMYIHDMRCG
ncbi:hypothetical protein MNEG_12443 [Monoraphidium neglectum]|uniref:Protein kinase domain-containing protein n=1 Tax=Monoraphidium neglectum TaxID=145388 RepID=A0A0D2MKU8_9CHLO|nr:hypothetical protein MNEG_12443 [Monoraphidium neglectum]KIY95520.1 hypothetical protein MNEG_12443 [Monoraphidium neglectum]|eukprot:XP_013894540.1 hypothetical protein MNEG_12443 [Monoraphidium neglectum]